LLSVFIDWQIISEHGFEFTFNVCAHGQKSANGLFCVPQLRLNANQIG
jgi:hypothetical protein